MQILKKYHSKIIIIISIILIILCLPIIVEIMNIILILGKYVGTTIRHIYENAGCFN